MKLIGPEEITQEEQDVRDVLIQHPHLHEALTWMLNGYHELLLLCVAGADPADVRRSLAKKEQSMRRLGIPVFESPADWSAYREQRKGERHAS